MAKYGCRACAELLVNTLDCDRCECHCVIIDFAVASALSALLYYGFIFHLYILFSCVRKTRTCMAPAVLGMTLTWRPSIIS